MLSGYCEDHVVPGGKLVTLFSAPDYPQFQVDGEDRYKNAAAYIVLRPPAYDGAEVHHFEAVLPRPEVRLETRKMFLRAERSRKKQVFESRTLS